MVLLDDAMIAFSYTEAPFPIRPDIGEAHRAFWERLCQPGSWWTGSQRVAIARESRLALICEYCHQRKRALSPYSPSDDAHTNSGELPLSAVDAVHRVVTDQSRITRHWVEQNAAADLSKEAYVELVGIVVAVFSIDEFHRSLGLAEEPLPRPQAGDPSHYRPAIVSEDMGFVPTIPPHGAIGNEADLWADRTANVVRALTLVPDALRDWLELAGAQYLSMSGMANLIKDENRSINRMQMELVAGRVSSVNECFY